VRPTRRVALLALAAGLGVTAACAAALRHPLPQDAVLLAPRWPGTTLADLERGRSLYVRRCSGCHTLLLPGAHPPEEWPRLVDDMTTKARLGPRERDDVVRFLVALASDGGSAQER
jgi:mono/diheme cytochrome c family protein